MSGGTLNVLLAASEVPAEPSGEFVFRETPAGDVDGDNTVFTLASTPVTASEQLYVITEEGAAYQRRAVSASLPSNDGG